MERSPNVLFLVVDSLRYDAVHEGTTTTPVLDQLISRGVVFSRAFSQGISTAPAMTAMLTGRYPLDYGGHWYIEGSQPTMAEQFRKNGYRTGAIHSNPNVSRLRNFDKGFDTFDENILPFESDGILERAPDRTLRYANKLVRLLRRTPYVPIERVNENILDWIESTGENWFLWTQYMDVHGPYLPGDAFSYRNKIRAERLWRKAAVNSPEEITGAEHEELSENYKLEVEYFDRELGRFLDELDERAELEDTILVLVGDHGDEFHEHGRYGHKNLPYDELTHVPMIVRFPDWIDVPQPVEVSTPVRCIDILPTVLDAVGAEPTTEMKQRMEGESLLPVLEGESPSYDVIVTEKEMRGESHFRFGFRTEKWKYLYDGKTDDRHLFDLENDPREQENVVDQHPDVKDKFENVLAERSESIGRTSDGVTVPDVEDDPGVEERLSALGYK